MNSHVPVDAWSRLNIRDEAMRSAFDALLMSMKPSIVCDVGSYNGDEAARFRRLLPEAYVFAFEGSESNIERFMKPRDDLRHVEIRRLALSDEDGETTFYIMDAEPDGIDWRWMANSLNPRTDGHQSTPVTVPCARLDTVFADEIVKGHTFALWIDVEGALDRVLAGAEKLLTRTVALKAEVEHSAFWKDQKLAHDIVGRIEAQGFIFMGDTHVPDASAQSDVMFVNRNWLDLVTRC